MPMQKAQVWYTHRWWRPVVGHHYYSPSSIPMVHPPKPIVYHAKQHWFDGWHNSVRWKDEQRGTWSPMGPKRDVLIIITNPFCWLLICILFLQWSPMLCGVGGCGVVWLPNYFINCVSLRVCVLCSCVERMAKKKHKTNFTLPRAHLVNRVVLPSCVLFALGHDIASTTFCISFQKRVLNVNRILRLYSTTSSKHLPYFIKSKKLLFEKRVRERVSEWE